MNLKSGTLLEFCPRAISVENDAGLEVGDLVLIVGWIDDKAACKRMRRPVYQEDIDDVLQVTLANDFDIDKPTLLNHFIEANDQIKAEREK